MRHVYFAVTWLGAVAMGLAQSSAPIALTVDAANGMFYFNDVADPARFGTSPTVVPNAPVRNFASAIILADIVAVNGKPAKGSIVIRSASINLRPAPNAGQAIADVVRNTVVDYHWEILQADGTPVGNIVAVGFNGGPIPPGGPPVVGGGNAFSIVGGTGAYAGIRGVAVTSNAANVRSASMMEDPANRRANGGGTFRNTMYLYPMIRPEILNSAGLPAIYHSDFSVVTPNRPATKGEVLIVGASGLGPTRPTLEPGRSFPSDPLSVVNSPVEVTVNGQTAEVLNQIGWPGTNDAYRVDFRVPDGTPSGAATIQLTIAGIPSLEAKISIR